MGNGGVVTTAGHRPMGNACVGQSAEILACIEEIRTPLTLVRMADGRIIPMRAQGEMLPQDATPIGSLAPLYPEWLGDRSFLETHGVRFPYIAGAMANGISTVEMVVAMAKAGMLGFFGAGGLGIERVEQAIKQLSSTLGTDFPWGANLINSPNEPELEAATADLYIKHGVQRVSASAYMRLSPGIVRYAFSGVHVDVNNVLVRPNYVFAKISRTEVAEQFMSPPPKAMLDNLVASGLLTATESELAQRLPVAEDITVEADSGGHTDNRPMPALLPTMLSLRDSIAARFAYTRPIRVGAAGGIGSPGAAASAFGMGASYVLTGSINQATHEAGLCQGGKVLLTKAGVFDCAMAPSPDMFELGVRVQVLKRGTLFAARAQQLYEIYTEYNDWDAVPKDARTKIEQKILAKSFEEVWKETAEFWQLRGPKEVKRANQEPRHKMALVFRWYVGLSSAWAIGGTQGRELDYQIWCGPAMGAFNAWAKGTCLEALEHRGVVQIAFNILEGAAVVTRAQQLRTFGVDVPQGAFDFRPRLLC